MRGLRRAVLALGAAVAVLYIAAAGYLYVFQRSYVFRPGGEMLTPARSPEAAGLAGVEPIRLAMRDGTELSAWYAPASDDRPTILYFHGNAGSVTDRADRFREIRAAGFGLLAASYRGYPGSGGAPSETALVADGIEQFDWLKQRTDGIVINGESLGTGVAVEVAASRAPRALALEAPFTAALDLADEAYPWIPTHWLMRDPFLSRERISDVHAPLLIVHGTADRTIPVEQARALFARAGEPKQIAVVEGGAHGDLWKRGLWTTELAFLKGQGVAAAAPAGMRPRQAAAAVRFMPALAGR